MSLNGKVVVVFGGFGDIGSAIFDRAVQEGACAHRFSHAGCDVTSTESVRSALGMVWAKDGRIDGVVCCQGAPGCIKPTAELTDDEWQKIIDVDLTGTFRICREAGRYLIPQGHGSIVLLSSIHAIATYPERAAYAAAKAGVCGLMRALAVEWAMYGVRVNAVLPGQVLFTRRTERLADTADGEMEAMLARSPAEDLPDPEAVANAVSFLIHGRGINGHSLVVDDGWTVSAYWKDHAER